MRVESIPGCAGAEGEDTLDGMPEYSNHPTFTRLPRHQAAIKPTTLEVAANPLPLKLTFCTNNTTDRETIPYAA